MLDRKALIGNLDVGDIFHAEYPNGASCVCRVLSVNEATIHARRMTTQENLEFDRQTGIERVNDGQAQAVINSVAPLPPEIHNVFLALERKYGQIQPEDWDGPDLERFKLTEAEKKALLFVDQHYASNPLPPSVRISAEPGE
jgi:hypothetical protein